MCFRGFCGLQRVSLCKQTADLFFVLLLVSSALHMPSCKDCVICFSGVTINCRWYLQLIHFQQGQKVMLLCLSVSHIPSWGFAIWLRQVIPLPVLFSLTFHIGFILHVLFAEQGGSVTFFFIIPVIIAQNNLTNAGWAHVKCPYLCGRIIYPKRKENISLETGKINQSIVFPYQSNLHIFQLTPFISSLTNILPFTESEKKSHHSTELMAIARHGEHGPNLFLCSGNPLFSLIISGS